jgi:hypothetical protein
MRLFKPLDELSLRHLFSTPYAEETLRLSYLGPVLNSAGYIESSPDAVILDMRKHPYARLSCEFKYEPSGSKDFAHNGRFDIAIVWSLRLFPTKRKLLDELLIQNGCSELLALDEEKAFRDLPDYSLDSLRSLNADALEVLREKALYREYESVFALCLAAQLYPEMFRMDAMTDFLKRRFPRVKKMPPKGAKNVVTAFQQTKPRYVVHRHGKYWSWTSEYDSLSAAQELIQLIRGDFQAEPPSKDDLNALR